MWGLVTQFNQLIKYYNPDSKKNVSQCIMLINHNAPIHHICNLFARSWGGWSWSQLTSGERWATPWTEPCVDSSSQAQKASIFYINNYYKRDVCKTVNCKDTSTCKQGQLWLFLHSFYSCKTFIKLRNAWSLETLGVYNQEVNL